MTRQSLILLGVCVLVLGGAWLTSRALTETSPGPTQRELVATPQPGMPTLAPAPTDVAVPAPVAPPRTKLDPRAMIDGARGGLTPTADAPRPVEFAAPPKADEPEEEANPFVGESRELDYADKLMWEQDGGVERLKSAREVYQRCVDSVGLERCKDGLKAVDAKLNPPKASVRPAPLPTLNTDAQDPSKTLPRAKP